MDDEQIGKRLRELRAASGKSRPEVAREMGIPYPTYAHHESGLGVRQHVERYAAYFEVSTDQLLGDGGVGLIPARTQRPKPGGVVDGQLIDIASISDETLVRTLRAALSSRRQSEIWQLETDVIDGAGYSPGDYLVVDLMQRPRSGDIVLAMRREGKREVPLFRAFYAPKLWCLTERQLPPGSASLSVDNVNIIVRGVVVLRLR